MPAQDGNGPMGNRAYGRGLGPCKKGYGFGFGNCYRRYYTRGEEKDMLQEEKNNLELELKAINEKLSNMEK